MAVVTDRSQMSVVLHREVGQWIAECVEFGYFGQGGNISDAIKSLLRDVEATDYTARRDGYKPGKWAVGTIVNGWKLLEDGTWKRPLTIVSTALRFDDAIPCRKGAYGFKALRLSEECAEYVESGELHPIPQEVQPVA